MEFDLSEEFQSKFELLKQGYIDKLPQLINELSITVNQFLQNPTEEAVKKAYTVVHNLSGSSGLYGYSDISVKSKEFDKVIKPFLEKEELPTEENMIFARQKFMEYLNFLQNYKL
ncbi:MAG: hypothetical protein PHC34_09550 [Candidatus Gastranaerophilales bacterium]|nr:hypothetical protein [Candidatus Gastranaerophilales bacterium]